MWKPYRHDVYLINDLVRFLIMPMKEGYSKMSICVNLIYLIKNFSYMVIFRTW